MRSRYDNQIGPTTIKRCRYRRQYRKKNRTRAQIKNGNYKRKNATTRKKYKGGFLGRLKNWWASRKNPYKLVGNEVPVNAWANVAEEVRQEAVQAEHDSLAAERLLNQRERKKLSWKDRLNGFRGNFTREQQPIVPTNAVPHPPESLNEYTRDPNTGIFNVPVPPPQLSHHHLTHQLQQELRDEANQLAASKRLMAQRENALAWNVVQPKVAEKFKPISVSSITNDDYVQMPPPYMFSNIDSITFRSNYQRSQQSVDEWNAFKDAVLMPTWNAQVGHMKAHVEFMGLPTTTQAPVFKKIIAQRNALLELDVDSVDPLSSHPVFTKSEAAIWKAVCDTEIIRNILIHSISNFTCAESIGTCLAFQRFLFPFSTDIVSELYKKRFPLEFEATPRKSENTTLNFQQLTQLKLEDLRTTTSIAEHKRKTEDIVVIKSFATMLLQSIMIQMSRDDYYCTYELNAKRELLLRLLICVVVEMTDRREIIKMLHMHMGILILFEVDDNKSKHYDEYKTIMADLLKGYAYAANQESSPYIQECEAIAGKYSKRLKFSRAAEIVGLPVRTNSVQQEPSPPHIPSAIIKKANAIECNSTTSIHDLESLCKDGNLCQSLGSLTHTGRKYHVYSQDKLCDTVTGELRDNATVFRATKTTNKKPV